MGKEIELKLTLAEEDLKCFLRSPILKQACSRTSELLINHYYDTPKLKLHKKGIALRLRRQGRKWLQTVKCAGESAVGLSSRPEWEVPFHGKFDFSGIDAAEVRQLLEKPKVHDALSPLFATDFRRVTWHLEPSSGSAVQLALDRGTITAAGRQQAICEVELELEHGDVRDLFAIAQAIAADVPLTPALLSKAERGFRLYTGARERPVKQTTPILTPDLTSIEAFRRIALACLEHLHSNHGGAIRGKDPEYLHQMRIATRRLRAAMRLFSPVLPSALKAQILPQLKALMLPLGAMRDLDVLAAEIIAPVQAKHPDDPDITKLIDRLATRQQTMRKKTVAILQAPTYGRLALDALALIHELESTAVPGKGLVGFTVQRLEKLSQRTRRLAIAAATQDVDALHAVRISAKLLRYNIEFCAPLLSRSASQDADRVLSHAQGVLGALNDLANSGIYVGACLESDPSLEGAIRKVANAQIPRYRDLKAQVPELLRMLRRFRAPQGKQKWT